MGTTRRIYARLYDINGNWLAPFSNGKPADLDLGAPDGGATSEPWLTVNSSGVVHVNVLSGGGTPVPADAPADPNQVTSRWWVPWVRVFRGGDFVEGWTKWKIDGPSFTRVVPRDPVLP
jgi:hypothetical protein